MSRLYLVVGEADDNAVLAEDVNGAVHRLSLLAFQGDPPGTGDWLVAHSGFALEAADPNEGASTFAEIRSMLERSNSHDQS